MKQSNMLNIVKIVGILVLTIGSIIFSLGFIGSGSENVTAIGIGTIVGGVFIFLMGLFLVIYENVLNKRNN